VREVCPSTIRRALILELVYGQTDQQMGMQLYGFWRSIASFRVRTALKLKGVRFEEIAVDILAGKQFEPDYQVINAEQVVPTLVHDGHTIFQSLAIIEYLDEVEPEPPLIPADACDRAYVRSLALVAVADAHPLVTPRVRNHLAKTFGANDAVIQEWAKHWTLEGLSIYERLLSRRSAALFVVGDNPGLADICIAGQVVGAHLLKLGLGEFPMVSRVADRCFDLPAFATSHPFEQEGYRVAGQ